MTISRTAAQRIVDVALQTANADDRMKIARVQALDYFLALDSDARAAHWRHLSDNDRYNLVGAQLVRVNGDISAENIRGWIDRYNVRYGSSPTGTEALVAEVLDELAESAPSARATTAARNAKADYQAGRRAQQQDDGSWRVPSFSTPGDWHSVSRDGKCDCTAALYDRSCRHAAQITGIEIAHDRQDAFDDAVIIPGLFAPTIGRMLRVA